MSIAYVILSNAGVEYRNRRKNVGGIKLPYVHSAAVILVPSFFIYRAISTKEIPLHSEW